MTTSEELERERAMAEATEMHLEDRVKELERLLVTCRIRCERAEKRLAEELRKKAVTNAPT